MLRIVEKTNSKIIIKLFEKIDLGIHSMLFDYHFLYEEKELELFENISELIHIQIDKIRNKNYNNKDIYNILKYEDILKPFIFRTWNFEVNKGCQYISWFKTDVIENMPQIVSTTFYRDYNTTFCNARYGISYEVSINGFLGANNKDAATLVENLSKKSIYTIGETDDGKIANSYNLATPIITPKQTFNKIENDYKSKHNEIILYSKFIKPISVIFLNESDLDMVSLIKEKYNIPMEHYIIK